MEPNVFRKRLEEMSHGNTNEKFVRTVNLKCDSTHKMFIVSVVGREEAHQRTVEYVVDSDYNGDCWCETIDSNIQDPYIQGSVVFRGYPFPKEFPLSYADVALLAKAYPKYLKRNRTESCGSFFMVGEQQSDMASRSMESVSIGGHHYHDKTSMDTLLVPMATR